MRLAAPHERSSPPPFAGQLRERGDPRAGILGALGVVRGACQHRVRPAFGVALVGAMELFRRAAEVLRFTADLVERGEPVEDVKRRVLQPLGHDRPGALLELHHEVLMFGDARLVGVGREFEKQNVAQEVEDRRVRARVAALGERDGLVDHRAVLGARRLAVGQVGAVDREARDDLAHGVRQVVEREVAEEPVALAQAVEDEAEHVDVVGQRQAHRQALLLVDERGEVDVAVDELLVGLGERFLRGGINEELRDVRREIVAGRSMNGPVLAQRLVAREDFFSEQVDAFPVGG